MIPKTFVFLGRSGSGKGTQAALLKEYLEKNDPGQPVVNVETGALMRGLKTEQSYAGELTREVVDSGALMPAFIPIWMWTTFLIKNVSGKEHLIFDGVARRANEAPILDEALMFFKRNTPYVVHLNVKNEEATQRLLTRARDDDHHEAIAKRLAWFDEHAAPAVEFFRTSPYSKVLEINGEQPIEKVHADIVAAVDWA